jgi:NhaA family Na+:H+ antiporter
MATDIAFSLGVASMLGKKVPTNLKLFLTALAIIDDLGAIVVIALFYGAGIKAIFLLLAMLVMGILWLLKHKNVSFGVFYIIAGILLWYLLYNSGIHATIAGVLFAFMVPQERLSDLEHKIHNYVNFGILPLFALANTAIILQLNMVTELSGSLSKGIVFGLFIGKPVGVFLAVWVMVKLKLADLPHGLNFKHMIGTGILAGIGFTMSIFIIGLAFKDNATQDIGKVAVLLSAILSIVAAYIWFLTTNRKGSKK